MNRAFWPFACSALVLCAPIAKADPVADFYKNKQIDLMISADEGSGYDSYARLLARHLGDHIPGKPTIIPENMPGAGGMIVANDAYNSAPRDGTTMFTLHFTLPLYQAMGGQSVRFDAQKFPAIGRLLASNVVIGVWSKSKSGVHNIDDALKKTSTIGSTGMTSNSTVYPMILNHMIGTKFKVVSGYRGEGDIFLAMERGEVDGFGGYSYLTLKSVKQDYLTKKLFDPIVQWGAKREAAWPDVPTATDLAKTPTDKRAMEIASAGSDIGFSYFLPPGVPADRVAAIRKAFQDMLVDPAFLADAKQARLDLRPDSAADVEAMVKNVVTAPPAVTERLASLMAVNGVVDCQQYASSSMCSGKGGGSKAPVR
jgi:tripartite-type tricarboxylate transporter receptor subunit TctC